MIEFKDPLVKVRCIECKEQNFIEMKLIGTDKEQRSLGFEYEHIYGGENKCTHCQEEMRLITTLYEYPKGELNYIDTVNEACIITDKMDDDSFTTKETN